MLSPDGKRCVDVRQDLCYDSYDLRHGICTSPRRGYMSRMTCCCTGAKAWGANCDTCPQQGSSKI